ncbi:hypothetical protein HK102_007765, partial [Quaeritorhiza haematococci]
MAENPSTLPAAVVGVNPVTVVGVNPVTMTGDVSPAQTNSDPRLQRIEMAASDPTALRLPPTPDKVKVSQSFTNTNSNQLHKPETLNFHVKAPIPSKSKDTSSTLAHISPAFTSQYLLRDHELGSGGFSFVRRATRKCDGLDVAVKFIVRSKVPDVGWARDPQLGVVPLEVYFVRQ